MKKAILLVALALGLCSILFLPKVQASQITAETLEKMQLAFTKNMGQWGDRVLFSANSGGATMWFTKEGVTCQFTRRISKGTMHAHAGTRNVLLRDATFDALSLAVDSGVSQSGWGFDLRNWMSKRINKGFEIFEIV